MNASKHKVLSGPSPGRDSSAHTSPVLVVDDDMMSRRMISKQLQRDGHTTLEAGNGEEALSIIKENIPSVVLMDVEMPVMDGIKACSRLRELYGEHVPVLMVTGSDDTQSVNRAFKAGATDFTSKPISLPLLSHRVRYLMRTSQLMNELASTVKELDKSRAELQNLAYFDGLTHLPNREAFMRQMQKQLKLDKPMAVMFLDVDDFKRINDTLGHRTGDKLLVTLAKRLESCIRISDREPIDSATEDAYNLVARFGGDEFTVLLSDVSQVEIAVSVAKRILSVLQRPMNLVGHDVVISPSIGIALYPEHGHDAEQLLKNADAAMYKAKYGGKNQYRIFSHSWNEESLDTLTLESSLRKALCNNELSLRYQPQLDLATGRIIGVEALVRWHCKDRGAVSPAQFIPIAESSGLIIPIGEWILRTACQHLAAWHEGDVSVARVAVNISAKQFMDPGFYLCVKDIINETGIPADKLELEITESLLMQDVDYASTALKRLSELGVELAIDDFGTGYSSLSYLKRFPINRLKIDQSFVRDILTSTEDAAITTAVIAMAHSLNLSVIAEGVETVEQLSLLDSLACDEIQGYLLSRPIACDQIIDFLHKHDIDWVSEASLLQANQR